MTFLTAAVVLALTLAQPEGMVEAAKSAKKKRDASTTRVITNKDVRQSQGKVSATTAKSLPDPPGKEIMTIARHEAEKRARDEAGKRLEAAEESVASLEAELARIEQQYYNEDDLDRRDGELVRRFADARKRHEAAVAELEAASSDPNLSPERSPVRVIGVAAPADEAGAARATKPPDQDQ